MQTCTSPTGLSFALERFQVKIFFVGGGGLPFLDVAIKQVFKQMTLRRVVEREREREIWDCMLQQEEGTFT